jgi:hypothetical protein
MGIKVVNFIEKKPIQCNNCKAIISEFKDAKMEAYNYRSNKWEIITVTECSNCSNLFGVIGLNGG